MSLGYSVNNPYCMSMRSLAEPKFQTVNPQRSWNLIPGGAETSNYHSPAETIQFLQIPQQVILKPENQPDNG